MTAKRKTNVENIVDIMEMSEHGALVQAFIIQGLLTYCDMIQATDVEKLTSGLIDGSKWKAISAEVKSKLDAIYSPQKVTPESQLVFTSAKDMEEYRLSVDEFANTNLTRGFTEDDGSAWWGSLETISNKSAFEDRPTWATCVYFIPKGK